MIQVLQKTAKILDFLANPPYQAKGLRLISTHFQMNSGTCANILKTLIQIGWVEKIPPSKDYVLGPMIYDLSRKYPYRRDLVKVAEPILNRLAEKLGESVAVATLFQGRPFILLQVEGNRELQVRQEHILINDPYTTASGRMLLAYLTSTELFQFLRNRGLPNEKEWAGASTKIKFKKALARIRKEKMAVKEFKIISAVSVPIWKRLEVVAALVVFLPTSKFKGSHRKHIFRSLERAAKEISSQLE